MLGRLARGAYLLTLALMIVAYAMSAAKSSPPPAMPTPDEPVAMWYC
jgi:hypothetical protein